MIIAFVVGRVALAPDLAFLPTWESYATVWACWLALYSAVVHGRRSRLKRLLLTALTLLLLGEVVREVYFHEGGSLQGLPFNQGFQVVYNAVFIAWPLVLGVVVRSLRERERELAAQTAELQHEREENARRAVLEERVRIARELHDVVAHHVSLMGIQAGAARRVLDRRPEQAEEILSSIEASSRQAVVGGPSRETGAATGSRAAARPRHPSEAKRPRVELVVNGQPRPLPATLEVSAYRVIQEALTNTRRHSGGATASVHVATDRRSWPSKSSTTAAMGRSDRGKTPAATG